jgi:hypothetical protein
VAAWEMAKMSRENVKVHVAFGGLDRDAVKINDHQNILHTVIDLSIPGFLPRQFVSKVVWKWAADKKELTVVADDVVYDAFPEREEYLRASSTAIMTFKQEAEVEEIPQTKVTYTHKVDLGGVIPKWVQNGKTVETLVYVPPPRERSERKKELAAAACKRPTSGVRAERAGVAGERPNRLLPVPPRSRAQKELVAAAHQRPPSGVLAFACRPC